LHFPDIEIVSNGDLTGLVIGIRHEPFLDEDNNIAYILEYDRNCFDIALSYETVANYSVPDTIRLVFNSGSPGSLLRISKVRSAILEFTLRRRERIAEPVTKEYRINLTHGMKRFSVNPSQFQDLQTELSHSIVLDASVPGCSFEDLLPEVLNQFRMNVVLDKQTSYSRTCWLSGKILDESVLIVLDGRRGKDGDRISIDVWSNLNRIDEAITEVVAETRVGDVQSNFSWLDVLWVIESNEKDKTSLTIVISSNTEKRKHTKSPVFFTVDYQGLRTKSFEIPFLVEKQQVAISVDLKDILALWHGSLTEPYIAVYLSDARWKSLKRSHSIIFDWKQALEQQIKFKLSTNSRFNSISEFSMFLNIMGEEESAARLFTDFCLNFELNGCETHRTADHCARAAIITGLVVCFDPPRGISGYLDFLTGPQSPRSLQNFGSRRTWRDHISQIAQDCRIFAPKTMEFASRNREKKPGRPPTRLIPTDHPLELFQHLLDNPKDIVCKFCRFYKKKEDSQASTSL